MSKISRGQQGEEMVIDVLDGIKEYHHLLNDVTIINQKSEMSHQCDHILIHPHGVFVIETKNYFGDISYDINNKQWWKTVKGVSAKINNPLMQNKSHAITLYKALKGRYEIIPVVVFVRNNAPYFPDDNVINLNDLLLFIESYPYKHRYTNETINKIKIMIESISSDMSLDEHLENIQILKRVRKENQNEIAYALENHKCPWCGSPVISKGYNFKCIKCDFKFKL